MAEKKLLVEKEELHYEGLFNLKSLFKEIDQYIRQHGYDRYEKDHNEQVTEGGRQVYTKLEPWKALSDYAKGELRVKMTVKDIQDVEVEHDGVKEKLQKGEISLEFQAWLITDYEGKWEGNPMYTFIRTVVDKFVHKTQMHSMEKEVTNDCYDLREEIKAFLNLYRYKE